MRILNYRSFKDGHLQGFVDIEVEDLGIEIRGLSVHRTENRKWVRLPVKDNVNGKSSWVVFFKDPNQWKHIENEVINFFEAVENGGQDNEEEKQTRNCQGIH